MSSAAASGPDRASTLKRLNVLLVIGIADFLLLLALLYVAVVDRSESAVSVLGPIHGVGYVLLLLLCAKGAAERRWGWWFPAVVLVTAGPPGTIVGDVVLRRRLAA